MADLISVLRATVDAGRCMLGSADTDAAELSTQGKPKLLVPIRSLGSNHRTRIAEHLFSLSAQDRYLRFGYSAQDAQINQYVTQLDFERDEIFGIYNRRLRLIAVAHLAMPSETAHSCCAEFGVSVVENARGRGLGARLFERASLSASNNGIEMMFIHALSENAAMLKIARNAGAKVQRDGAEAEAYLKLPSANFDSQLSEIIGEQVAQFDYQMKVQAKQFWDFLTELQEVRRATKDDQRLDGS